MAKIGYLANLQYESATGPSVWTVLGDYVTIKLPDISITSVESTPINAADAAKQFIPGLVDYGSVNFEIYFVRANMTTLFSLVRAIKNFKITEPDGSEDSQTFSFSGFIEKISGPTWEAEGVAKVSVDVKITGKVTLGEVS